MSDAPTAWRGFENENEMTEADRRLRHLQQGLAMREGGSAFDSSPDQDGLPTGGCYNMDYPDSWHDELNKKLDEDEYYEAKAEDETRKLWNFLEK